MSVIVIFTVNGLEFPIETIFNILLNEFILRVRINWDSFLPIVLGFLIEERIITKTVRWNFVNELQWVNVNMFSYILIEVLTILWMITHIVFTLNNVRPVVPGHLVKSRRWTATLTTEQPAAIFSV